MKYVLDANVALRWVLKEQHSDKAKRLRDDLERGVHELHVPDFFVIETAHALTKAERRRAVPQGQAVLLLAHILSYGLVVHESRPLALRAAELSSQARASVYDCTYLVLAEELGCDFVTADRKLISVFPNSTRIVDLAQF